MRTILCLFLLGIAGVLSCTDSQRQILLSLWSATDGPNWDYPQPNMVPWNSTDDFCSWGGVGCSIWNGCSVVTSLDLRDFGLRGIIPEDLGLLSNLRILRLGQNFGLFGLLPNSTFANMSKLQYLDLARTSLWGAILFSHDSLISLQAYSSQFTAIEASSCVNLQEVLLAETPVRGFPSSFNSNNLCKFKSLQTIDLSSTQLDSFDLSCLCQSQKLSFVALSRNRLQGSIPSCLGELPKLHTLLLASNNFTYLPFDAPYPSLAILDVERNQITGNLAFAYFPALTSGWFGYNNFGGLVPLYISPVLAELGLQNNPLFGNLEQPPWSIQLLDIQGCPRISVPDIEKWTDNSKSELLYEPPWLCPVLVSDPIHPRRLPFRLLASAETLGFKSRCTLL